MVSRRSAYTARVTWGGYPKVRPDIALFCPEMDTYENLLDLGDFLEELLQRRVDLVAEEWMSERLRKNVMAEATFLCAQPGATA